MLRSLFSGVSGLRNHQVRMDVIGNNIANVNTVAFKQGRVTFQEGFASLLQGATRPQGDVGGQNPTQIGLGMQVGSIDTLFTQGTSETTGVMTDLAIQGESFFVVSDGSQSFYTRAGNFQLDANGKLVSPTNGYVVQGRTFVNGEPVDGLQDIVLPFGQKTPARATTEATLAGNLDASAPVFTGLITSAADRDLPANANSFVETTVTVYDSLGATQDVTVTMWKTAANEWSWSNDASTATGTFRFNADGTLDTAGSTVPDITFTPTSGASPVTFKLDTGSGVSGLSQFAARSTAQLREQDGYTSGTLESFSIDATGTITGAFSNGVAEPLAQVALADFNNPSGMLRVGDNMYSASSNSGVPVIGHAGDGAGSQITSGALEMSNVDLAQEFTNMIVAQRGFQANSKVITTSDEMLQELVGLKR
jgi:flagellar hook protein FlgE